MKRNNKTVDKAWNLKKIKENEKDWERERGEGREKGEKSNIKIKERWLKKDNIFYFYFVWFNLLLILLLLLLFCEFVSLIINTNVKHSWRQHVLKNSCLQINYLRKSRKNPTTQLIIIMYVQH